MHFQLRAIQPQDNPTMARLIRTVMTEYKFTGPGTAHADPELERLYETYQGIDCGYWVIEDPNTKEILGGAGFSRLKDSAPEENIAELQKLYFYPALRGSGWGPKLLHHIIKSAQTAGYRTLYLETSPAFERSLSLYKKMGFRQLPQNRGNTGHQNRCSLYFEYVIGDI